MSIANDLLTQALNLPPQERAALAHELLQSLPDEDDTPIVIDEEYEDELLRRIEDIRLGRAKTVDLETFKQTLRDAAQGKSSP